MLTVENPLLDPQWDDAIAPLPGVGIFHTRAWAKLLTDTYGYSSHYVCVRRNSAIVATLPLMEVRSAFTGRRGVSLPFTDMVNAACGHQADFDELFSNAIRAGKERAWRYLEVRGGHEWLPQAKPAISFYNHRKPLSPDSAGMLAACDEATRRSVRKGLRGPVEVRSENSPESLREFYRLLQLTRRKHGVPPQPVQFFDNLRENILKPGHGHLFMARHRGKPIAGAVFLHFARSAVYKYGASDEKHSDLRGNHAVMWHAICHYGSQGMNEMDFGRTSVGNTGLRRYKLGWGTIETEEPYFRYNYAQGGFEITADRSSGVHSHVFRALPLGISRVFGKLLYRHLG